MDVILFGPPGAGKGTQAGAVSKKLAVPHVSTGDMFRKHLKEGTELGLLAKGYMEKGALVPDSVVVDIVASRLVAPDAGGGAVFDGFPRTVAQAELLAKWLQEHERSIDLVLNLVVPDEAIVARLSGRRSCLSCGATYHVDSKRPTVDGVCDACGGDVVQRDDDRPEVVQNRIEVYHRDTKPVLDWLREHTAVVDINANQAIALVEAELLSALAR